MSLEQLLEDLESNDLDRRIETAIALGELGQKKAVAPLTRQLRDPDAELRTVVCEALGLIGDARAVSPLVTMLRDPEDEVRGEAFSALLSIGQSRAGSLPDDPLSMSADAALTQIVWPADLDAVKLLMDALDDPDPEVRIGAIYTLGRLGIGGAFDAMRRAVTQDRDTDVKRAAAFAMGELGEAGDRRVIGVLIGAWTRIGEDDGFAVDIVRALSALNAPAAFDVFVSALKHRDDRVRQLAVMGLGRLGDVAAGPKLIRALKDPHGGVRRIAAHALGLLGDPMAIKPLLDSIVGENSEVRASVSDALTRMDRGVVHQMLVTARLSPSPDERAAACYVSGRIGFVDGLENLVVDPEPTVRKAACLAIGNCRDLRYREILESMLDDPEWTVRVAGAEGLRRLGDPTAGPALQAHASDPHKVVRNAIRVALGALETA